MPIVFIDFLPRLCDISEFCLKDTGRNYAKMLKIEAKLRITQVARLSDYSWWTTAAFAESWCAKGHSWKHITTQFVRRIPPWYQNATIMVCWYGQRFRFLSNEGAFQKDHSFFEAPAGLWLTPKLWNPKPLKDYTVVHAEPYELNECLVNLRWASRSFL